MFAKEFNKHVNLDRIFIVVITNPYLKGIIIQLSLKAFNLLNLFTFFKIKILGKDIKKIGKVKNNNKIIEVIKMNFDVK